MRRRRSLLILLGALLCSAAAWAEPLLLVGPANLGTGDVSSQELSRIFLGLSRDLAGQHVTPAVVADKSTRAEVIGRAVGKAAGSVEQHFVKLELRGEGRWPALIADARTAARRIVEGAHIDSRPAVLVCLRQSDFEALTPQQQALLKVLTIDGKGPKDQGYPLTID